MAGFFSRLWNKLFPKQMTKEEFILKAKEVHGDFYDYSKVRYTNENTRVAIICPKHGKFLITPKEHLEGKGCEQCVNQRVDGFLSFINEQSTKKRDNDAFWNEMIDDIFGEDTEENDNDESSEDNYIGEYSEDKKTLLKCPEDFKGIYRVPNGVTTIGKGAFNKCQNLEGVVFPDTISTIGVLAFSECGNLKKITIPKQVEEISNGMLAGCISLKEVIMHDDISIIKAGAFACCANLKSITLPKKLGWIQDLAFYECHSLQQVIIPKGCSRIMKQAFYHCENLTSVTLPQTILVIGQDAFSACPHLKEIRIPNELRQIFLNKQGVKEYSELLVGYPINEAVDIVYLFENPQLRGKVEIRGGNVIIYDCNGKISHQSEVVHPQNAHWVGNAFEIGTNIMPIRWTSRMYCGHGFNLFNPEEDIKFM